MTSKSCLSVVDFGADTFRALTARRHGRRLEILGVGQVPAAGFCQGQPVSLTDAVEAVREVLEKVRPSSAGGKIGPLYYNYDDPLIETATAQGSGNVDSRGPIRQEDVAAVLKAAKRFLVDCRKTTLYAGQTGFIVDDKDRVSDPIGIYGRKLGVTIRALLTDTARLEAYGKIFRRVFVPEAVGVLSILSSLGAVKAAVGQSRALLWDLGRDYLGVCATQGGTPLEVRECVCPEAITQTKLVGKIRQVSEELLTAHEGIDRCVLTGDWADQATLAEALQKTLNVTVSVGTPSGYPQLESPRYASLVGLLLEAERLNRKDPRSGSRGDWVVGLKQKATSFINEYF